MESYTLVTLVGFRCDKLLQLYTLLRSSALRTNHNLPFYFLCPKSWLRKNFHKRNSSKYWVSKAEKNSTFFHMSRLHASKTLTAQCVSKIVGMQWKFYLTDIMREGLVCPWEALHRDFRKVIKNSHAMSVIKQSLENLNNIWPANSPHVTKLWKWRFRFVFPSPSL